MNGTTMTHRWLTEREVAEKTGVAVSTLQNWRSLGGRGPSFAKVGRLVRYSLDAVDEWMAEMERQSPTRV
ncbi:hypothetical protein GCM10022198_14850 [Klugiella xanthotipulae]|uniref:Excisionase family DNA binding protein n=1 Tax=Klugiella xanthotipulae TaxID=244735 RepID=A0A543I6J2_9MICO|nr:helix-turn-helix domain-containing protein [Klugiella xanthotipulae]TQM66223.1 excisionase family DNA binding protein [Klugiella xanthotipulae]